MKTLTSNAEIFVLLLKDFDVLANWMIFQTAVRYFILLQHTKA